MTEKMPYKRMTITIPRDLFNKLEEISKQNHTTKSAMIQQLILKYKKE